VEAFPPTCRVGSRLEESELRRAVLANMADEKGAADDSGNESREHSDIWLDFAQGMGARRDMTGHTPIAEISGLMAYFHRTASEGTPAERWPRSTPTNRKSHALAQEKARGLREMYGADEKTCGYSPCTPPRMSITPTLWRQQLKSSWQQIPRQPRRPSQPEKPQPSLSGTRWMESKPAAQPKSQPRSRTSPSAADAKSGRFYFS